ncbi:MAG: hypothetical protein KTR31_37235 [Myxococcales bacterium]|nr:hypothetical protein [Myxococcales bacterium]
MSEDEPTPPAQPSRFTQALRRIGVTLGIALVAAVGSGAYVWLGERARAAEIEQGLSAELEACNAAQSASSAASRQAAQSTDLLRARLELAHAQGQLEQGNFGIAKTHVRRTDELLRGATASGAGAVAESLASVRVDVTEDLGATRAALQGVADSLDALLDVDP